MLKSIRNRINHFRNILTNKNVEDVWNDTADTFPVQEVYSKSRFNIFIITIIGGLSVFCTFNMLNFQRFIQQKYAGGSVIVDILSAFSILLVGCLGFGGSQWISIYYRHRQARQERRLKYCIKRSGVSTINPLLDLLDLIVKGHCNSQFTGTVITNLRYLLLSIDDRQTLNLTPSQREILCSLVNLESSYYHSLRKNQKLKITIFSIALTTPAIQALGMLGGDDCLHALRERYKRTHSDYIRHLITKSIKNVDETFTMSVIVDQADETMNIADLMEQPLELPGENPILERYGIYIWGTLLFLPAIPILIMEQAQQPVSLMHYIGYLSIAIFIFFPLYIAKKYQRRKRTHELGIHASDVNIHKAIRALLSTHEFGDKEGYWIFEIMLGELFENVTPDNRPRLNPKQLASLNSQVYVQPPEYEILPIFQDNLTILSLIRAVGLCGDASSVRILERYLEETKEPALAAAAVASLETLNERLKLNPEELLQASAMPNDVLLKPASCVSESDLLKITATEGELKQTESVAKLGNRQS